MDKDQYAKTADDKLSITRSVTETYDVGQLKQNLASLDAQEAEAIANLEAVQAQKAKTQALIDKAVEVGISVEASAIDVA